MNLWGNKNNKFSVLFKNKKALTYGTFQNQGAGGGRS